MSRTTDYVLDCLDLGLLEHNIHDEIVPTNTGDITMTEERCEQCHSKGWIYTFNTEKFVDEIQKCDDCNKYSTDFDAIREAIKEAEISIACLMDEPEDITMEDLEHIQDQLQIISGGK